MSTSMDAVIAKLSETANRIADERNELLALAVANLAFLEDTAAFIRRHADKLPHYAASGLDEQIERTRGVIANVRRKS